MCKFHHRVCVCVCFVCPFFTDKVPHFSRLGDVEVNAGQNASFQCVATGKVSETEPFLLEVRKRVCVCVWGCFPFCFLFIIFSSQHLNTCISDDDWRLYRKTTKGKKDNMIILHVWHLADSITEEQTIVTFTCMAADILFRLLLKWAFLTAKHLRQYSFLDLPETPSWTMQPCVWMQAKVKEKTKNNKTLQ